jgi:flagellar basal body rod protein FlgC
VIDALTIATAGMTAAASRAGAAAEAIATPDDATTGGLSSGRPRVGYLPLPADPISAFASLQEAETSFKANAMVLRTAAEMIEALYKAID